MYQYYAVPILKVCITTSTTTTKTSAAAAKFASHRQEYLLAEAEGYPQVLSNAMSDLFNASVKGDIAKVKKILSVYSVLVNDVDQV